MFRRYRRIAWQSPLVGFVVSAGLFLLIVLPSAIGQPWRFSLGETVRSILTWGLIGVAVALTALLGGMGAIAILDRGLTHTSLFRVSWAGIGAGLAVCAGWLIVGLIESAPGWLGGYLMLGAVAGIIAAIAAAALVNRAERRAADAPVAHPLDADRPDLPVGEQSA
ncbi:hypothetical protein [Mycetocola zhujimingii]|uniref:hypothetical protein n=1 Tax=Mycetocola zhujimingii TaxID=2079792 RepID=UPI000D3AA44A|nr:hypothetical protein [Mycetocola zhujimingii]AWB85492.1 hypothetical protein C3E77_01830 [Mycetocola zhujimingii]